jgi:lipopolysaccharide export system protein LptA
MKTSRQAQFAAMLTATLVASLASAHVAMAQAAAGKSGGFGFSNEGGPIDISADRSETFQPQRKSVWEGNVIAVQGQDKLQTPRLEVYFAESGNRAAQSASSGPDMGRIERMEADGPVFFITPTQRAKGDHATYDATSDTITLTGNVLLVQDKNVVKGERLVIEQKTGHSTLYAGAKTEKGRVRAVFYPNSQPAPAAAPKPAKKP